VPLLTLPYRQAIATPMRRVVILGNAGSGKSTLARRLGERLGLPVVHLDVLFWEPGWTKPDNDAFRAKVRAAIAGEAWICEGNYVRRTFDLRLPRADQIIWMDTSPLTCLSRVIVRSTLARPRADLPAGCEEGLFDKTLPEFLVDTWRFNRKARLNIEAARKATAPDVPVVHLSGKRQIDAFIDSAV
jgi:adenylate kinase family enzyme